MLDFSYIINSSRLTIHLKNGCLTTQELLQKLKHVTNLLTQEDLE